MKHLITGGAGFIGSHLAEALHARGDEVLVIDDLTTGRIVNLRGLTGQDRFRHWIDTITNEPLLAELIDEADVVHHLAAAVGVKLIVESPVRTIETNIRGTELVLKHCAKKGKRVLVASTSEVYGKSTEFPFREDGDLLLGPSTKGRWSYACSKLVDEFLALSYWHERQVPTTVVRLFNTVGPRQVGRYGMVVPTFVSQALQGGPITVYDDGAQSRCFCHVADTVRALIALTESDDTRGRVFNVGNDQEVTILELAERVRDRVDPSVEIQHIPYEEAYEPGFEDMRRRVPSIAKIRDTVGWEPTHDLDRILDDVIAHMREELEA